MTAPMLASIGGELPSAASGEWVFEPKYDGVRVLAHATKDDVALVSRNGIDKAHQLLPGRLAGDARRRAQLRRRLRAARLQQHQKPVRRRPNS